MSAEPAADPTITVIKGQVHRSETTKTDRARVIDLDAGTAAALRSWKAAQAAERLVLGAGYQDEGLVFTSHDGTPPNPNTVSRTFDRRVARHGLERIRLHDLRHTWATVALANGVHPKVVQERLGHSSITVTMDIYSHVMPAMHTDAADRVAALILGGGA